MVDIFARFEETTVENYTKNRNTCEGWHPDKRPHTFYGCLYQDQLFLYWIARLWFWMLLGFLTLEYWFLNIGLW